MLNVTAADANNGIQRTCSTSLRLPLMPAVSRATRRAVQMGNTKSATGNTSAQVVSEMINPAEFVLDNVAQLQGPDAENAYYNLLEADHAIVPLLIETFRAGSVSTVRATLVEIIWRHHSSETVEFLAEALNDSDTEVWKSALDGLVSLGGSAAIEVLQSTKVTMQSRRAENHIRAQWIDEAMQQIKEKHG